MDKKKKTQVKTNTAKEFSPSSFKEYIRSLLHFRELGLYELKFSNGLYFNMPRTIFFHFKYNFMRK